jgi:hypothetical protein
MGSENPHVAIQHSRDSAKVNVFCAVACVKVYGPFLFVKKKKKKSWNCVQQQHAGALVTASVA